ncbi:hypothetical protein LJC68_09680, partial [Bacteroidales bacterium OttesenSCG-928-B11]|nr:hypothetical protein [Bacteroidales bacterium OttesenSCG-928-E04]MDL2313130.1 hypothetical protein [Bacteroidales bacterium OttesenSCG-928-B11]MDL2326863.1 hypothetical protein [Bacteroidales bacterium OttesenSCG-928-A14]
MKKFIALSITCFPVFLLAQSNSWDGKGIKPNSELRVLNMFISVIYDVNPAFADSVPNPAGWPAATSEGINHPVPDYIFDFMDTVYSPPNLQTGLTKVYGESSFDSLRVIGGYIVVNVKESRVLDKGYFRYTTIASAAIDVINESGGLQTLNGRNSIRDYDYLGNGQIYYAFVVFRNIRASYGGFNSGSGIGSFSSLSYDKLKIGNDSYYFSGKGAMIGSNGPNFIGPNSIATHEMSHSLFGGNDFHTTGGNHRGSSDCMPFFTLQGGYGLMGASSSSLVSCNGYERWRMHWKNPQSPYYIAARNANNSVYLNSDVSKESGNVSFLLRDFVTYGDAVRIKLPYKDSEDASNQYIWLENHQVGNNGKQDYLYWSESDCRPAGKPGIYAYYQVGRDVLSGTGSQVWFKHERDNIKPIPAEGYYDYAFLSEEYYHQCIGYVHKSYALSREAQNPFCGAQDMETHFFPPSGTDVLSSNQEYSLWRKKIGHQIIDSLSFNGDDRDAFSSYAKINMGTNPSTCNAKTYYNYMDDKGRVDFTSQTYRNNQTTYLTGLSIEMVPAANQCVRVNIRWDDYDVDNDTRWSGSISNKEQVNLTSGNTVELVQNKTVAQPYRDSNTGFFAQRTVLVCEDGSFFTQQPNTSVVVSEKSKLLLKNGAQYEIKEGAELRIGAHSFLEVEEGSLLIVHGKLIVEASALSTIKGLVKCSPTASILVRPGGKLVVDGGTLTNACDGGMWQGIFVEGNSLLPQTAANQGTVELKNGAILEHAVVGITTTRVSGQFYVRNTAGGIIKATSTTFRNNQTAVKILPYTNKTSNGNIILDNACSFTLCNFSLDQDNLLPENNLSFSEHAYLSGVRGVKFSGCSFTATSPNSFCQGINAHNAGFSVKEYCPTTYSFSNCVCTQSPTRSSFSGFSSGISIYTTGTQHAVTVDRCDFANNNVGMSVEGMNNVRITRSNFVMYSNMEQGVTLSDATGYHLEENSFSGRDPMFPPQTLPFTPKGYGIYIYNSGANENSIYRNSFSHVTYPVMVNGNNGSSTLGTPGLQFTCNQFTSTGTGIVIYIGYGATIRAMQGTQTKGADNDFVSADQAFSCVQYFNYYYSTQTYHVPPMPLCNYIAKIPLALTFANPCGSTLCNSGPLYSPTNASPSAQYEQLKSSLSQLQAQHQTLSDAASSFPLGDDLAGNAALSDKLSSLKSLEQSMSDISLQMNEISQREIFAILQDSLLNLAALSEWYDRVPTLS